jgi:hypothetical protein
MATTDTVTSNTYTANTTTASAGISSITSNSNFISNYATTAINSAEWVYQP